MAGIALMRGAALALALLAGAPAAADVAEAVEGVIGPAYMTLAERAAALDAAAQADCSPEGLREPFQALWDAWARIDFLGLGPVETDGRTMAMHFWPDPKASGTRAQQALIDADPPAIDDPAAFAELSVALRGLAGMERLVYPSALTGPEDRLCRLRRATAADLAAMTAAIRGEWPAAADLLLHPGAEGNSRYLSADEARQALYTQVITGLGHLADTRLGRPLGTFEKPRPERAEAVAAGRSLRNVVLSLEGMRDLALALHTPAPQTETAFARALGLAAELDDPVFAGVAAPASRLRVEALQQAVLAARDAVEAEIGGALGVSVGFNAKDGD